MTTNELSPDKTVSDDLGLSNPDLAPLPPEKRRWTWWNYSTVWMGIVHNIVAWQVAANLIKVGLSFWQALACVSIAYGIAFLAILANSVLGAKYGTPFPVLIRASFGPSGAQVPVFLRAFVAVFWFAVHIYIGSQAISAVLSAAVPDYQRLGDIQIVGMGLDTFIAFVICWLLHAYIIGHGMEAVKKFEVWAGPSIMVLAVGLVIWAVDKAGSFGLLLDSPATVSPDQFWPIFILSMTGLLGTVATLILNIADLSRFSRSQRDQAVGQGIGFPVMFFLFSAMSLLVASGSKHAFGEVIVNPIDILTRLDNRLLAIVAALCVLVATASVNVATNGVSVGFDLTNLWPSKLTFKRSGMFAIAAAVLFVPWLWYDDTSAINTILGAIGATMGPVTGILLVDFYIVRRRNYDVAALFSRSKDSIYTYRAGWNPAALIAFALGAFVALIGLVPALSWLYAYNWFLGIGIGGIVYLLLMLPTMRRRDAQVSS